MHLVVTSDGSQRHRIQGIVSGDVDPQAFLSAASPKGRQCLLLR
jgi:hypothetical protein